MRDKNKETNNTCKKKNIKRKKKKKKATSNPKRKDHKDSISPPQKNVYFCI